MSRSSSYVGVFSLLVLSIWISSVLTFKVAMYARYLSASSCQGTSSSINGVVSGLCALNTFNSNTNHNHTQWTCSSDNSQVTVSTSESSLCDGAVVTYNTSQCYPLASSYPGGPSSSFKYSCTNSVAPNDGEYDDSLVTLSVFSQGDIQCLGNQTSTLQSSNIPSNQCIPWLNNTFVRFSCHLASNQASLYWCNTRNCAGQILSINGPVGDCITGYNINYAGVKDLTFMLYCNGTSSNAPVGSPTPVNSPSSTGITPAPLTPSNTPASLTPSNTPAPLTPSNTPAASSTTTASILLVFLIFFLSFLW